MSGGSAVKKLLILAILLVTAPSLMKADGVGTPAGTSPSLQTDSSGTTLPAKKVKRHRRKKATAESVSLFVTDQGFVPAELTLKKGVPVNLVVTRQTNQTCATAIVIPDYGLSRDLPLNVPETLSFTPKDTGEIRYSCGMGMIGGVLSVE
jgi:hypothetical protein